MHRYDWGRLPLLLLAVVMLLAAGGTWLRSEDDPAAVAMIAAALVLVGSWTALEVIASHRRLHREDTDPGTASDDGEPDER